MQVPAHRVRTRRLQVTPRREGRFQVVAVVSVKHEPSMLHDGTITWARKHTLHISGIALPGG